MPFKFNNRMESGHLILNTHSKLRMILTTIAQYGRKKVLLM
jgi:hypothetical protein